MHLTETKLSFLALLATAPQCAETTFTGSAADDLYGWSLADASDVDGDLHSDLLIGVPQSYHGNGRAELRSGRDGRLLFSWSGSHFDE